MTLAEAAEAVVDETAQAGDEAYAEFATRYPHRRQVPEWAKGAGILSAVLAQLADGSRSEEPAWELLAYYLEHDGTAALLRVLGEALKG